MSTDWCDFPLTPVSWMAQTTEPVVVWYCAHGQKNRAHRSSAALSKAPAPRAPMAIAHHSSTAKTTAIQTTGGALLDMGAGKKKDTSDEAFESF